MIIRRVANLFDYVSRIYLPVKPDIVLLDQPSSGYPATKIRCYYLPVISRPADVHYMSRIHFSRTVKP